MRVTKVAQPGKDIDLEKDLAINSLRPSPKISTTATPPHTGIINLRWNTTTPIPDGTKRTIYEFKHGYGYIPTAFAVYEFDNTFVAQGGVLPFQYGALGVLTISANINTVRIEYVSIDPGATVINPFTMTIRYYVMAEKGYDQA